MFYNCNKFNRDVNFNTSKVTNMSCIFWGCDSLEEKNKQLIMR